MDRRSRQIAIARASLLPLFAHHDQDLEYLLDFHRIDLMFDRFVEHAVEHALALRVVPDRQSGGTFEGNQSCGQTLPFCDQLHDLKVDRFDILPE